ncbi:MAG TPA: hypothetical protein VI565_09985 [Burkholderiales bacterium]|nr:hypothetical protein [Burkholderiales bacterium]
MKKILAMAILAAGVFAALPANAEPVNIADTLYVDEDLTVWQETNGVAGLQRVATDAVPADTQIPS